MPFWSFKNLSDEEAELFIEGEIVSDDDSWIYEWFGIAHAAPNAFRAALKEYKGKNITVWIDSWGGDVFAGVGMYNALKEHKGKVTAKITKAVSAASLPIMAAKKRLMSPGGIVMVHNPWTIAAGEYKDMIKAADILTEVKDAILNIYQTRVTKSREALAQMMDNEEWMSAKKAVSEGFADEIMHLETDDVAVSNSFSISRLAVMNSAESVMKHFFEQMKKMTDKGLIESTEEPEETPANQRVFDIARRVSVREKQNRRNAQWTN